MIGRHLNKTICNPSYCNIFLRVIPWKLHVNPLKTACLEVVYSPLFDHKNKGGLPRCSNLNLTVWNSPHIFSYFLGPVRNRVRWDNPRSKRRPEWLSLLTCENIAFLLEKMAPIWVLFLEDFLPCIKWTPENLLCHGACDSIKNWQCQLQSDQKWANVARQFWDMVI